MNTSYHGREISAFEFLAADGHPYRYMPGIRGIEKMYLSATNHGDRDEFWIIIDRAGIESERHNVKFVNNITWAIL